MDNQAVPSSDLPEEVPHDDLPSGHEVPQEDLPDSDQPSQQAQAPLQGAQKYIGMGEAALRGAAPFGSGTLIETTLGVPKEDIKAREAALDPMAKLGAEAAGTIGSMFVPGVGEGWLIGKAAQMAVPIAKEASALAKVGRLALRGGMEMGSFAGGDEISDAFLDKGHDATAVAGHIASAGALGMLTAGTFGAGGEALQKIQSAKLGEHLDNIAIGLGAASQGPESIQSLMDLHEGRVLPKGVQNGIKLFQVLQDKAAGKLVDAAAGAASHALGGGALGDAAAMHLADKYLAPVADKLASKYMPPMVKKVMVPVMLQAIKIGEHSDIANVLGYANKAAKGSKLISNVIENTLNMGGKEALHASEDDNDRLHQYIENGGINQQIYDIKQQPSEPVQSFAEGGSVEAKPIETKGGLASLYPTQNQMIATAKGRVSNYLTQLRPQPPQKMLFDTEHMDPAKERIYRNALSVANAPLSVLTHVKNGTVTPEHIQHIKSMYPELHEHLSRKITDKLVNHKFEDDKQPGYGTRQGLSLFLGAPLDSTMTPSYIQAAQTAFIPAVAPQQQQAQKKDKKGTASLGKFSKDYETPEQQRQSRATKS